jgi:hypothetical protein
MFLSSIFHVLSSLEINSVATTDMFIFAYRHVPEDTVLRVYVQYCEKKKICQ